MWALFFWTSCGCIFVAWVAYPVILYVLVAITRLKKASTRRHDKGHSSHPSVSFIVAAHNEERNIGKRIENLREVAELFLYEIIIGSDGSTDKTVEVVESFGDPSITAVDFKENRGRASVHNDCSRMAKGDLLVFTDAETIFAPDFMNHIVPHFEDATVGAVAGRIYYLNEEKTEIGKSAGVYWKYEEFIRICESKLGILAFGTGAALAVRRNAYTPMGANEDIDYAGTLEMVAKGYRVHYEPTARAYDYISETILGAYNARVRQTSRCFGSVLRRIFSRDIMIRRFDIFVAALLHKTFRHLTPVFMLATVILNLLLLGKGPVYRTLLFGQLIYYGASFAGYLFRDIQLGFFKPIISMPYNFTLYNLSRGIGLAKSLFRREKATYTTVR